MFKRIAALTLLLTLSLGLFSSQAFAWGQQKSSRRMKNHMQGMMFKKLALTEKQRKHFLSKKQQMERDCLGWQQKNEKIRLNMRAELKKDPPNRSKLHGYIREINKNQSEIQIKRMDLMLDMHNQLTPEQKAKFKEMTGKMEGRMKDHMKRPMGHKNR